MRLRDNAGPYARKGSKEGKFGKVVKDGKCAVGCGKSGDVGDLLSRKCKGLPAARDEHAGDSMSRKCPDCGVYEMFADMTEECCLRETGRPCRTFVPINLNTTTRRA